MQYQGSVMSNMTRRILRQYDGATPEQLAAGTSWYMEARRIAGELADQSQYTLEQTAGVIAVLSPQVNWDANVDAATLAVHLHSMGIRDLPHYGGYRANVAKAWEVLDGNPEVIRGPKVTAFYRAILGDLSHVTVDAWAIRAARSKQRALALAYLDTEQDGIVEKRAIAEAYRRAAALRGVEPSVMQAVVWTVVRESKEWSRPRSEGAWRRFYARQVRARQKLGMPVIPKHWGNRRKQGRFEEVALSIVA